jgi:opacity protein-like surface antigen
MLKNAAVVGIAGLMLGASPAAANSIGDAGRVALTMIGGGGATAIGCMAIALLTEEVDEGYDRRGLYLALGPSYARENFSNYAITSLVDGELQENLRALRGTPIKGTPTTMPPGDRGIYSVSVSDVDDDTFGVMGRVGYRCHPHVSSELQFEWLDDFNGSLAESSLDNTNDTLRNFNLSLETLVFTANMKGHLLTGRFQPFVLGGFGFMRMETKSQDITPNATARTDVCPADSGVPPDPNPPCWAAQESERQVNVALRIGGGIDFYLTESIVMSAEASYLMPTGKLDNMDFYSIGLGLQYRF